MELYEVVVKLVGPVSPVGDTHVDGERLKNLHILCELVESLIEDISRISLERDVHMASVKAARGLAAEFIHHIKQTY